MNSKIGDKMLTMISAVAVIDILVDLLNNSPSLGDIPLAGSLIELMQVLFAFLQRSGIYTWLKLLFVAAVIVGTILYKRSYVNLYSVLQQISENNKLHPVRAKVMVTYKALTHGYNPFPIEDATYQYTILPVTAPEYRKTSVTDREYQVQYSLSFTMKVNRLTLWWANRRKLSFRFYAIVDNVNGFDIDECYCMEGSTRCDLIPVWHDVTRTGIGGDKIRRYSGLQEITLPFPKSVSGRNRLSYHISYTCKRNFRSSDMKYSFAIIPDNYSRKIRRMRIIVKDTCAAIKNIELQEFDGEKIRNPTAFTSTEEPWPEKSSQATESRKEYRFLFGPIKPDMNSLYFFQYDFVQPDEISAQNPNRRSIKENILHFFEKPGG